MNPKSKMRDLFPLVIIVGMLALAPVACVKGSAREANADYEKCLSWQADGHNIRCSL